MTTTDSLLGLVSTNWPEVIAFATTVVVVIYAGVVRSYALENQRWQEDQGANGGLDIQARAAVERTTLQLQSWSFLCIGMFLRIFTSDEMQIWVVSISVLLASERAFRKSRREQINRHRLKDYFSRRDKRHTDRQDGAYRIGESYDASGDD